MTYSDVVQVPCHATHCCEYPCTCRQYRVQVYSAAHTVPVVLALDYAYLAAGVKKVKAAVTGKEGFDASGLPCCGWLLLRAEQSVSGAGTVALGCAACRCWRWRSPVRCDPGVKREHGLGGWNASIDSRAWNANGER
jgi:hypothetical protein